MSRQGRWIVVVVLLTSGLTGCAAGPSRGWFSRRSPVTSSEDEFAKRLIADANRLAQKGDMDGARKLMEQARLVQSSDNSVGATDALGNFAASDESRGEVAVSQLSDQSAKPQRSGGLFDVPSNPSARHESGELEAPAPKVRPNSTLSALTMNAQIAAPKTLTPPPNARPVISPSHPLANLNDDSWQPIDIRPDDAESQVPDVSADMDDSGSKIVAADYQTDQKNSPVELTGGVRSNPTQRSAINPWEKLRELTGHSQRDSANKPIDWPTPDPTESSAHSMTIQPGQSNSMQIVPGPLRRQATTGSDISSSGRTNAPAQSGTNLRSPEPWPGSRSGFAVSNQGDPTNRPIQNVSAWPNQNSAEFSEQRPIAAPNGFNAGQIPGFDLSMQPNRVTQVLPTNDSRNQPFVAGASGATSPWGNSADWDRLIAATAAEAASMTPGETEAERLAYLRTHVQLRMLSLIAGQLDRALQPVPGIDPADQEFWQQMLWSMANYFDSQGMPDATERATQTIAQLKLAVLRLQSKARLELHNVAFCHKIVSFGNYQRFKRDEFTAGQPVLLYAEVANFQSEQTTDGQFRTLMKSSIEIVEGAAQGPVVETIPFPASEDRCRNQRHDYFLSYEFAIPAGMASGPHVLRLTVEDQLNKKRAITTLNFTVQ